MDYDGNILIDSAEEFSTGSDSDSAFGSARYVLTYPKEEGCGGKEGNDDDAGIKFYFTHHEIYILYSPSDAFSIVSGIHNYRFENGRRYIHYHSMTVGFELTAYLWKGTMLIVRDTIMPRTMSVKMPNLISCKSHPHNTVHQS